MTMVPRCRPPGSMGHDMISISIGDSGCGVVCGDPIGGRNHMKRLSRRLVVALALAITATPALAQDRPGADCN